MQPVGRILRDRQRSSFIYIGHTINDGTTKSTVISFFVQEIDSLFCPPQGSLMDRERGHVSYRELCPINNSQRACALRLLN